MVQVSRLVRENLMKRATRFNLVLDDVSITHVAFSPEFTHAVEAKQVCLPAQTPSSFPSHLLRPTGRPADCAACSLPRRSGHPGEAGMWPFAEQIRHVPDVSV